LISEQFKLSYDIKIM